MLMGNLWMLCIFIACSGLLKSKLSTVHNLPTVSRCQKRKAYEVALNMDHRDLDAKAQS